MPKIRRAGEPAQPKPNGKPNPFDKVEAPSDGILNQRRLSEEIFFLERTLSNNVRASTDIVKELGEIGISLQDILIAANDTNDLLKQILDRLPKE